MNRDEAVEAMARAILVARGLGADTLYQHHEWEDFPADAEQKYIGQDGEERTMLLHYAWRKRVPEASAALTAAEPFFKQDRKDEWQPIETAPKDEPFLAAVEVRNNKTGERWWDRHVIWIDGETEEVHHDTDAGWAAGDYTHWMPLPPPPPLAVISAKAIRSLSEQEEGDKP